MNNNKKYISKIDGTLKIDYLPKNKLKMSL